MNDHPRADNQFFEVTPENIAEMLFFSRNYIEERYGIKLSVIELFHLRKTTEAVLVEVSVQLHRNFESHSTIAPWQEIPQRFLQEYYGFSKNIELLYLDDHEAVRVWFMRQSDSIHYP